MRNRTPGSGKPTVPPRRSLAVVARVRAAGVRGQHDGLARAVALEDAWPVRSCQVRKVSISKGAEPEMNRRMLATAARQAGPRQAGGRRAMGARP